MTVMSLFIPDNFFALKSALSEIDVVFQVSVDYVCMVHLSPSL